MGTALRFAQVGDKHPDAKPLKDYGSAQILEVVIDDNKCTYRGVYTVESRAGSSSGYHVQVRPPR